MLASRRWPASGSRRRELGARPGALLRAGDPLVRPGGDEFAVLLEDAGRDDAVVVAGKLCASLIEQFALEDMAVHSSGGMGIALFPDHGSDLSTLLRKADIAMYWAKAAREGHHVYGGANDDNGAALLLVVEGFRAAMAGDPLDDQDGASDRPGPGRQVARRRPAPHGRGQPPGQLVGRWRPSRRGRRHARQPPPTAGRSAAGDQRGVLDRGP